MRKNTADLMALPEFSIQTGVNGVQYGNLRLPSVATAHHIAKTYARTLNENNWLHMGGDWTGLEKQSPSDFDSTGIANNALNLTKIAIANISKQPTKPGAIRNTVTGGSWDIPSVLSGLPLSARSRIRTKLPPINLRVLIFYNVNIDARAVAPLTAKIARAIWDYTLAGGVVTLTVFHANRTDNRACHNAIVTETRVNASDISAISLALSPTFIRTITGPLRTAFSTESKCGRMPLPAPVIPNVYDLSGDISNIIKTCAKLCADLKIS